MMSRLNSLKADLPAGLVVFLVALPLCLGIALASNAPLFSGVISGIVAGLVVALISGSEVSVSGPAAGLTIIVASGITTLGSFESFLLAVVLAGALQLMFGMLRLGALASLFPNSVVTGMLTAIGIIIILKQIPHGLGRDADYEGDLNFFQFFDQENTFTEIVRAFAGMHTGVVTISLTCLFILVLWNSKPISRIKFLSFVPGPLLAVVAGVSLNHVFSIYFPNLFINAGEGHMVELPTLSSTADLFAQLRLPSFDINRLPTVFSVAITIAIVASIETLLSIEAAERIDPYRRISYPNKELIAQGLGNMICGMVGGLPITAVIVRTSANIYAGAKTRMSGFIHGLLLLGSLLTVPHLLNQIPLGSLAAILIVVGYKLARPRLFTTMYRRGVTQFVPFMVTVVTIVFTDLLTGVFSGMVASMFFVVKANAYSAITFVKQDDHFLIRFTKDVSFANKSRLKSILASIPNDTAVLIDGSSAVFIDQDIFDEIDEFRHNAAGRSIRLSVQNMESKSIALFSKPPRSLSGVVQEASSRQ